MSAINAFKSILTIAPFRIAALAALLPLASQAQLSTNNRALQLAVGSWGPTASFSDHAKVLTAGNDFGIATGRISTAAGEPNDNLYLFTPAATNRDIRFMTRPYGVDDVSAWQTNMIIKSITGKVGIGVPSEKMLGDYKLYVAGGILTERCRVALSTGTEWRDEVFAADYKLQPLSEVEAYVKTNKHLPGVPAAEELVKEGIDVTRMLAAQMGKIEELTLHLIEAQKKMAQLEATVQALKAPEADKTLR